MTDVTLVLDTLTGTVLLEDHDQPCVVHGLMAYLGPATEIGCARPPVVLAPLTAASDDPHVPCLRVVGYYHNSLIEGPGRRSSLLVSGCDLGCRGCWVPALHPADAGQRVPVDVLADALLDPGYERDGISILGGEPMQQCEGVLALVQAVRARGCPHILMYSGYTYERLRRMATRQPAIDAVLDAIDMLIDGPYIAARANGASPWTGSSNQRVINLAATRRAGKIELLDYADVPLT